jgi:hypothetical protein
MKGAATLAAALALGLVVAGCTNGPSATVTAARGPSATVTSACESLLQIKVPPGTGQPGSGVGLAIALPSNEVQSLIHSDDPKLAEDARKITDFENHQGVDSAFIDAQTQCRKLGVG